MKPVTETHYRARIERVIKALSDEPEVPRSLDELARIAHFSRFHFHRIYRAMVGEGVIETARRLRLARAALFLATTDSPVTEIAMDSGYQSVQTFSRAFRNLTNVSPREFRDRGMQLAQLVVGPRPIKRGGSNMEVEIVERSLIKAWTMRLRGAMTPENFKDTYARLWQWQIDHESQAAPRKRSASSMATARAAIARFATTPELSGMSRSRPTAESNCWKYRAASMRRIDWLGRITEFLRHSNASMASGYRRADSLLTIGRR